MDTLAIQVRRLLAQGFTPAEICEAMPEFEPASIRAACGALGPADARDVMAVMYGFAMDRTVKTSDRIKAGIYVNEELNGRNEKRANTPLAVVSLAEFNQRLQAARRAALPERARPVIDIAPAPALTPADEQLSLNLA